jgi:GR25 family glycosyltransferase involved in LPS biosynthesis
MIIHCVSLPRASERRRRIHREWVAARGFDVRFFDAFDRRQVGVEPLPFAYDDKLTRARLGRSLSSGEIACAISHAQLVRQALDGGCDDLVVLEDDAIPLPGTTPDAVAAVIAACRAGFPRVSALLLHELGEPVLSADTRAGIHLAAPASWGHPHHCTGYLGYRFVWLSRAGLSILARDLPRLLLPADWFWQLRFAPTRCLAYPERPLACDAGIPSYIGAHALRGGESTPFLS